jgi:hypothetical protein
VGARPLTVRGLAGVIRWGYFDAARVDGWTVTRTTETWTLAARIVSADPFKLTQRPLMFVAAHQQGAWHWPIERCEIAEGAIRARLGPPVD